jgi:hypothetical protein
MTTVSELLPHGEPTLVTAQAPSKALTPPTLAPPPPPLGRAARRAGSGLLRRAGSTARAGGGAARVPDSERWSLPMLPPTLPCACAMSGTAATASEADTRRHRRPLCIVRRASAEPHPRSVLAAPVAPTLPQGLPVRAQASSAGSPKGQLAAHAAVPLRPTTSASPIPRRPCGAGPRPGFRRSLPARRTAGFRCGRPHRAGSARASSPRSPHRGNSR